MLAQRETDGQKRRSYLERSIDSLKSAVAVFKKLDKFGPDHPEVGDCYSLAAAPFWLPGSTGMHGPSSTGAAERLKDETDKDYLDYLILEGDYAVATGDLEVAEAYYQRVIDARHVGDSERSEIRGRVPPPEGTRQVEKTEQGSVRSPISPRRRISVICWGSGREPLNPGGKRSSWKVSSPRRRSHAWRKLA